MLLAINGDLGSGKSELAGRIAAETGWRIVSMGAIQRSVASSLGISTLEMNRRAETDPAMDEHLRRAVEELRDRDEDLIIDSRLAFHFLPEALSIHLVAHPRIAAERVLGAERGSVENYADLGDAQTQLTARRAAERQRYFSKFGVEIERFQNYRLVVQTDLVTPGQVFAAAQEWLATLPSERPQHAIQLNPRALLPAASDGRDLFGSAGEVEILRAGDLSYIASGIERIEHACQRNEPFISASVVGQDDERVSDRLVIEWAESSQQEARIAAWEAKTGVAFDRRFLG